MYTFVCLKLAAMQISDQLSVIGFFGGINIGCRYMPKTHISTPQFDYLCRL